MGRGRAQHRQEYWDSYSNLRHVKHGLIREYLNGWFPKLGSWAGRILYIDTHAGRGRHATGQLGSPLVALATFLRHNYRDAVLSKSEIRFVFIEHDQAHLVALKGELTEFLRHHLLPRGVHVEPRAGDCQEVIQTALDELRAAGLRIAPTFAFVDPYGFKISYGILRDLMGFGRVEVFVNVMWRYLDMAIAQARTQPGMARLLDLVFDGADWRTAISADDYEGRAQQTLALIQGIVNAKWATPIWMRGTNRQTEYVLLHLTNHDEGRDLMKRVMWHVCPSSDGVFSARKTDDPDQGVLLILEPDLQPLSEWVKATLASGPARWQKLHELVRETSWLEKHLNATVRELLRMGRISARCYRGRGRLGAKANPLLVLRDEPGSSADGHGI